MRNAAVMKESSGMIMELVDSSVEAVDSSLELAGSSTGYVGSSLEYGVAESSFEDVDSMTYLTVAGERRSFGFSCVVCRPPEAACD